jgi:hypothetical protein
MLLQQPFCDPTGVFKSPVQDALDKAVLKLSSLVLYDKKGACDVPANVGIRFFNCEFEEFKATKGGNTLYFENCTFNKPIEMTDAAFVMSGCKLREGGTLTRTKGELVPTLSTNPDYNPSIAPPIEEIADYVSGETESTKAPQWEEFVTTPCVINNSLYCVDYTYIASNASIWEWTESVLELIKSIEEKAMLIIDKFSVLECYLDKFLNIPFQIVSLVDNSISKLVNCIFSKIDKLLEPIFKTLNSLNAILNAINSLISTIQNVASSIVSLKNRCVAKITSAPFLLATQVVLKADIKSRIECQLVGRMVSLKNSVISVSANSGATVRNCKELIGMGTESTLKSTFQSFIKIDKTAAIQSYQGMTCAISQNSTLRAMGIKVISTESATQPTVQSTDEDKKDGSTLSFINCETIRSNGSSVFSFKAVKEAFIQNSKVITSGGTGAPILTSIDNDTTFKNVDLLDGSMNIVNSVVTVSDCGILRAASGNTITAKDSLLTISNMESVASPFGTALMIQGGKTILDTISKVGSSATNVALNITGGNLFANNVYFDGQIVG